MQRQDSTNHIIDGLIPEASVNILVGDSGLGKSPLAYQMAYCVCTGSPFLGHRVKEGRVLHFDLENGGADIAYLTDGLRRHFRLPNIPNNFFLKREACANPAELQEAVRAIKPDLVMIDSLRAYDPEAEKSNSEAGVFIGGLKEIARQLRSAFVVIHHVRKGTDKAPTPQLESTPTLVWLKQACGARALTNQTDVRIAVDSSEKAALVIKFHARIQGESGPLYVAREADENGEPLGYQRMTGVQLLYNPSQEDAYRRLPDDFRFREAMTTYGKTDDPTRKFLKKCISVGILEQLDWGRYKKVKAGRDRVM